MTSEDKLRYGIATAVGAAGALVIGYILGWTIGSYQWFDECEKFNKTYYSTKYVVECNVYKYVRPQIENYND